MGSEAVRLSDGSLFTPGLIYQGLRSVSEVKAGTARAELLGISAEALVLEAEAAGLSLRAEGGRVVVRGPQAAEALVGQIRSRKAEVMAFLERRAAWPNSGQLPSRETAAGSVAGANPVPGVSAGAVELSRLVPPPGSCLHFQDYNGRPCDPAQAYLWTWEGADRWYYASAYPPPTHG
jgi:hypothetical protein